MVIGAGAGAGAGASVRSHHTVSSDVSELDQERGNNLVMVNSLGHSTACSYKVTYFYFPPFLYTPLIF